MDNKYIKYLSSINVEMSMALNSFLKNGNIDELQEVIANVLKVQINVDGILGSHTIIYLTSLLEVMDVADIVKAVIELSNKKTGAVTPNEVNRFKHDKTVRQILMAHLAEVEGTVVHYNIGEKSWTSPYGVYKYAWKNTDVVSYIDSLYKKYGLNPDKRADAYRFNTHLKSSERDKIANLVWSFYQHEFLDDRITTILKRHQKSMVSWFSISVNGGIGRGVKALQFAVGASIDGVLGKHTFAKMIKVVSTNTDDWFNQRELRYMHKFYYSLIRKRPNKFIRFTKGWMNRLKSLGYKTNRTNCSKL